MWVLDELAQSWIVLLFNGWWRLIIGDVADPYPWFVCSYSGYHTIWSTLIHHHDIVWVAIIHIHHHKLFPVSPVEIVACFQPRLGVSGSAVAWVWLNHEGTGGDSYVQCRCSLCSNGRVVFSHLFTHTMSVFYIFGSLKLQGSCPFQVGHAAKARSCLWTNQLARPRKRREGPQGAWPHRAAGWYDQQPSSQALTGFSQDDQIDSMMGVRRLPSGPCHRKFLM